VDHIGVWINGGGLEGFGVDKGNAGISKQSRVLGEIGIVWGGQ